VKDLQKFRAIMLDLRESSVSPEEVSDTLRRETPWFADLAVLLLQNRKEVSLYLALLLQIVQLALNAPADIGIHDVNLTVEIVYDQTIKQGSSDTDE